MQSLQWLSEDVISSFIQEHPEYKDKLTFDDNEKTIRYMMYSNSEEVYEYSITMIANFEYAVYRLVTSLKKPDGQVIKSELSMAPPNIYNGARSWEVFEDDELLFYLSADGNDFNPATVNGDTFLAGFNSKALHNKNPNGKNCFQQVFSFRPAIDEDYSLYSFEFRVDLHHVDNNNYHVPLLSGVDMGDLSLEFFWPTEDNDIISIAKNSVEDKAAFIKNVVVSKIKLLF